MKRLALILFFGGCLSSCNDGDLIYDNLNFSGNIEKCSDKEIFYKLNNNEILFTYLPGVINKTNPIPLNQEIVHEINNSNDLIYRQYSDKTTSNLICGIIAPATPSVIDEFKVNTGGKIIYKRIRKITQNDTDAKVSLDYIYTFNFKNIVLTNGSSELKYENYFFGDFIDSNVTLNFSFISEFSFCDDENQIFAIDTNQGMKISSPDFQFNETTGTQSISLNNSNFIEYYYFSETGSINNNVMCDLNNMPADLNLIENWKSTAGTLEIVTTANSTLENPEVITGYTYTLYLKNVTFTKDSDSFTIANQLIGKFNNN